MSALVESFLRLLENYNGPHREKFNRLWDFHQKKGTLEQNLMAGFKGADISPEQFIESVEKLEGDSLQNFYSSVEENREFVNGMNAEFDTLPAGEPQVEHSEYEDDDTGEPPRTSEPAVTREQLSAMMADPRYKNDPSFRDDVTRGFQSLYGDQTPEDANPSSGRTLHGE